MKTKTLDPDTELTEAHERHHDQIQAVANRGGIPWPRPQRTERIEGAVLEAIQWLEGDFPGEALKVLKAALNKP